MVSGEGLEKRGFAEVSSEQSEGERRRAGFKNWMMDYRWGGWEGEGKGERGGGIGGRGRCSSGE